MVRELLIASRDTQIFDMFQCTKCLHFLIKDKEEGQGELQFLNNSCTMPAVCIP